MPDLDIEALFSYSGLGGSKNSDYSSAILGTPRIASDYNDGFSDSIGTLRSMDNFSWAIGAKLSIPLNNNVAESDGAGIYIAGECQSLISDLVISNNECNLGAGVFVTSSSDVNTSPIFTDIEISNNLLFKACLLYTSPSPRDS